MYTKKIGVTITQQEDMEIWKVFAQALIPVECRLIEMGFDNTTCDEALRDFCAKVYLEITNGSPAYEQLTDKKSYIQNQASAYLTQLIEESNFKNKISCKK